MRKDLLAIGLGAVLSGVTLFSSLAADSMVALRGHVPAAVANGKAQLNGSVSSDKVVNFTIGLPLRNREALSNLLEQISDPASANYRHYLTPQQFTEHFGPTEQDYQKVIAFAKRSHLTIKATHRNRVLLSVSGTAADIEKTFNVHMNRYQHPTEGREFFAPDREPTVSSTLPILQISGLDDYSIPHPNSKMLKQLPPPKPGQPATLSKSAKPAAGAPAIGSGLNGSYQGADFRTAYVPGTTLTGAGQNVALLQFDGFYPSDIAAYASRIGLITVPNIVVVPVDGGVPVPGGNNSEVSLDIEMVLSMAPGVSSIYVYEAPNPSPWVDLLGKIADDDLANQVSASWGGGGPNPVAEQIFQQMAVQGQTYFNASGDSDAIPAGSFAPFPSDSPHITVVGGTTLTTAQNTPAYVSETVWNWGNEFGPADDGLGSSGGISPFYPIPSWQTNINFIASHGSPNARNFPDVALTGDNVLVLFGAGQFGIFGGTSCASPLWAGFTALANQQSVSLRHAPLGFLNPAIYAIANSANYTNCFHDTVTGDNTWSSSPNLFHAATNYDLCTGLGTPNGTNLINALVALGAPVVHISPPPPPYGLTLANLAGGNPNGSWFMFVRDDAPVSSGFIDNGWILSLTTADVIGTAGDLELLMNSPSSSAFAGQPVTFVLTVTNYGPSISTNVSVVDTLPLTATVVSTNTTQGSVIRSGTTLIWNVGTLNTNLGASLVLVVQPHGMGSLLNSAIADAGTPDPNPDDDSASATVDIATLSATLTPSFASSNRTFYISVPGPTNPSVTVVIQANTNLTGTNWMNIYTGTPPINFSEPVSSNYVRRFYRALLLP